MKGVKLYCSIVVLHGESFFAIISQLDTQSDN